MKDLSVLNVLKDVLPPREFHKRLSELLKARFPKPVKKPARAKKSTTKKSGK